MVLHAGAFGELPLFVATESRVGASPRVSRSIADLVRGGAALDPLGLATVLCLGFPLGSRTVFRGVERAAPGACIRVSDASVVRHGSMPGWTQPPASPEALFELTIEAVRWSMDRLKGLGSPIVPLSGGRDSRLIYLALRSLGVRPRSLLTFGRLSDSPDAQVARKLATRLRDPIEFIRAVPFDGATERWRQVRQNFESLEHSWFLSVALRARALGGPVTDGIGAGVLSTGSLMHPESLGLWMRGQRDELAEWTFAHAGGTTPEFRAMVRSVGVPIASDDEVREALVREFRALEVFPNPLGTFSLLHWTRRGISASAFGLLPSERVVAPLYDPQLVASLLAMETEQAMREDWREVVLRRLDQTGIGFAESVGTRQRRRMGNLRGSWAWSRFESDCGRAWKPLFDSCRAAGGPRRSFARSAIGLLQAAIAHGGR
jgi:hypothetical protein